MKPCSPGVIDPGIVLQTGRQPPIRAIARLRSESTFGSTTMPSNIDPRSTGCSLSFALDYWKKLGEGYPPAMVAPRNIRGDKTAALIRGDKDRDLFHDVASINQYLGEETSTYELFRALNQSAPAFAQQCFRLAIDAIVAAKDFDRAARYAPDPESTLLEVSEDLNRDVADHKAGPSVKAPRLDAYIHIYCDRVRNTVRILSGIGRPLDAEFAREWAVALVEDEESEIVLEHSYIRIMTPNYRMHLTGYGGLRPLSPVGDAAR
jgi:hypothetical protein